MIAVRIRNFSLYVGLGLVLYFALCLLGHAVHAAVVVGGDPIVVATTAADSGWDVVTSQGPLLGGLLLAYALYRRFLAANESKHWIAQGKTLSILTAVGMVVGAAAEWKFKGAPAAGIITALFAAISLVSHSTVSAKPATASSGAAPAVAMLFVLLGGVGLALSPACSWRQRTAAGAEAFIDCESPHIDAQLLAEATALGKAALVGAISGSGHTDAGQLKAAAAPLKSDLMRCGLAAAIAAAMTPAPAQPGAPAAAPLEVDGPQLKATFAGVRGELGWQPVHVAGAVL